MCENIRVPPPGVNLCSIVYSFWYHGPSSVIVVDPDHILLLFAVADPEGVSLEPSSLPPILNIL